MVMTKKVFLNASIILLVQLMCVCSFGGENKKFDDTTREWLKKSKAEQLVEINKEIKRRRLEEMRTGGTIGENYRYNYSTDKDKQYLLKNTIDRAKAVKNEVSEISKKVEIYESPKGGLYMANFHSKTKNARFAMIFWSADGGIRNFSKFIIDKKKSGKAGKMKYDMSFYGNGNIQYYTRRTEPKETLAFDRNGKLKRYSITLQDGKSYSLRLNEDGTIKRERVITATK